MTLHYALGGLSSGRDIAFRLVAFSATSEEIMFQKFIPIILNRQFIEDPLAEYSANT